MNYDKIHPRPWTLSEDYPIRIIDAEGGYVCDFMPSGKTTAKHIIELVNEDARSKDEVAERSEGNREYEDEVEHDTE